MPRSSPVEWPVCQVTWCEVRGQLIADWTGQLLCQTRLSQGRKARSTPATGRRAAGRQKRRAQQPPCHSWRTRAQFMPQRAGRCGACRRRYGRGGRATDSGDSPGRRPAMSDLASSASGVKHCPVIAQALYYFIPISDVALLHIISPERGQRVRKALQKQPHLFVLLVQSTKPPQSIYITIPWR